MAGANAIVDKILADARAEGADILSAAKQRADRMTDETHAKLKADHEKAQREADALASQSRERMTRVAELDLKKAALAHKRTLIDEAFNGALSLMAAMSAKDKQALIKRLLLDAAEGGETIAPAVSDAALFDNAFIVDINAAMVASGKKPVKISGETRPIEGGFVLISGGAETNCSFKDMIELKRKDLELDVAKLLFPDGKGV